MFVRWKKRQLIGDSEHLEESNLSLYAVLVQNHRVEGKTRQKVVKYLGYINEANLTDPSTQERFWQQVVNNLQALELGAEDYQKITTKLAEVVPNPLAIAPYIAIPCMITASVYMGA